MSTHAVHAERVPTHGFHKAGPTLAYRALAIQGRNEIGPFSEPLQSSSLRRSSSRVPIWVRASQGSPIWVCGGDEQARGHVREVAACLRSLSLSGWPRYLRRSSQWARRRSWQQQERVSARQQLVGRESNRAVVRARGGTGCEHACGGYLRWLSAWRRRAARQARRRVRRRAERRARRCTSRRASRRALRTPRVRNGW